MSLPDKPSPFVEFCGIGLIVTDALSVHEPSPTPSAALASARSASGTGCGVPNSLYPGLPFSLNALQALVSRNRCW